MPFRPHPVQRVPVLRHPLEGQPSLQLFQLHRDISGTKWCDTTHTGHTDTNRTAHALIPILPLIGVRLQNHTQTMLGLARGKASAIPPNLP